MYIGSTIGEGALRFSDGTVQQTAYPGASGNITCSNLTVNETATIGSGTTNDVALTIYGSVQQQLGSNTTYCTQFGSNALTSNTTGQNNTAFGYGSMQYNTTGYANTSFGANSLYNNTGSQNVAVGHSSLQNNEAGSQNVSVGNKSLLNNSTGTYNTALGNCSNQGTTTASYTTALGSGANSGNYTESTALGYNATNTANNQVMLGTSAETVTIPGALSLNGYLSQTLPTNASTQFGSNCLTSNTSANNSAFGYGSMQNNTTGVRNASFGDYSLNQNTTGTDNTAIGHISQELTTGINNTSIGSQSLANNTSGCGNTAIGFYTLISNTNEFCNTAIGYMADSGSYSYSTALGYSATNTANNQVMLGTSAETVQVPGTLTVNGNSTIGTNSSNISTVNAVPNFVNGFRCAGANAYSLFMGTATYSSGGYDGSTSIPPYIGSYYGDGNAYYNLDQTITGIVGCFINSQNTNFTMWYVSQQSTTQLYLS